MLLVLQTGKPTRPYSAIYKDVERLCLVKHTEQAKLADSICENIEKEVSASVGPAVEENLAKLEDPASALEVAGLLVALLDSWKTKIVLLLQLYLFLDRAYLMPHPKKHDFQTFGFHVLTTSISRTVSGKHSIGSLVTLLLRQMRIKGNPDTVTGAACLLACLYSIDKDAKLELDALLLKNTVKDYNSLSLSWLEAPESYVSVFIHALASEAAFFKAAGVKQACIQKILGELKWKFLLSDLPRYAEASIPSLVLEQNRPILTALKEFCGETYDAVGVNSTKLLVLLWSRYCQSEVAKIFDNGDLLGAVLALMESLSAVCLESLSDESFEFEIRAAFSKVLALKDHSTRLAAQLARYCESLTTAANASDKELGNFVKVFKIISNKVAFLRLYEVGLATRMLTLLLFNTATEIKLKNAILSVMGESDDTFTIKAMFRDYESSLVQFQNVPHIAQGSFRFDALVFEDKVWPQVKELLGAVTLPDAYQEILAQFERQYEGLNSKLKYHRLDWSYYKWHRLTIAVRFAHGAVDLNVNLLQAVVLTLFELSDTLQYSWIIDQLQMDEKLLKKILESLSTPQFPVLGIDDDVITFNEQLTSTMTTIALPYSDTSEPQTSAKLSKLVYQGRSSEIRLKLVHIMKSARRLPYTHLLARALEALEPRGHVSLQDLKREVEYLISSEYLGREDETTLVYIP